MKTRYRVVAIWVVTAAAGCGAANDYDEASAKAEALRGDEQAVLDTILVFAKDGTVVQSWSEISSPAQRKKEATNRVESSRLPTKLPLGLHAGCDHWDALWLFDGYSATGNRLCLSRSDPSIPWYETIDLSTIAKGKGSWEGAVRSLWAGVNPTLLYSCGPIGSFPKTKCYGRNPEPLWFDAWEYVASVPVPAIPYNTINLNTP